MKTELNNLKNEVSQLRAALETAESSYRDEYIQSTLQIRNAYELVEHAKSESRKREAELEAKLKESGAEVEELRTQLLKKENALQSISCENKSLNQKLAENQQAQRDTELEIKLQKSESVLEDLRASLLDKEARLQIIAEENEKLKSEITKRETEEAKQIKRPLP
ncbi:UNVERIFIED_CONTAM: Interactor of constitutive active ROPs 2, chloroplastic [Sesamum angustifolium]|uniref:Interactor of constitutive active ROPs 2, chloroplastic n=1 Tax=Sesamum angustifolium TaxID=2727405 RepID=A0AAW2N7F5_9LAMI